MEDVLDKLESSRPEVADEIRALQAIFEDQVSLHSTTWQPGQTLRIILQTTLTESVYPDNAALSLIISLPPDYPTSQPPQMQLSGKYIGDHLIESDLFGSITRIFMHEDAWQPEQVVVFDGIERAKEIVEAFLATKKAERDAKEEANPQYSAVHQQQPPASGSDDVDPALQTQTKRAENGAAQKNDQLSHGPQNALPPSLPAGCKLFTSEPIVDRKSVFIGHACAIKDPSEVKRVVDYLLMDRKIAKAAHPVMRAYRWKIPSRTGGEVVYQDNDDDGESAAGSRLAHLLQILEIDNILVVVTRWYGGVHLGSDRFKHINQAARDALQLGGFIPTSGKK